MSCQKLSHVLMDRGFFSALGTTEIVGGVATLVGRGKPNTYDYHNGVYAVFDEEGRPWVLASRERSKLWNEVITKFKPKRGASVPHGYDDGHFVKHILPTL